MLKFHLQKTYLILIFVILTNSVAYSQLTGIKTINPNGQGLNNYTTFYDAIQDLNNFGVGTGGVVFNVESGAIFNETQPLFLNTTTTNINNQIIFQKSNIGSMPILYADTGTKSSSATATYDVDFIIKILSTDYVTFDGIDFRTNIASVDDVTITEYGIFLTKTPTDACKNITIKNCNFLLNNTNSRTICIYQSNLYNSQSNLSVASQGGRSENNVYHNNSFNNTGFGIYINGTSFSFNSTNYNFQDNNNLISNNKIINFTGRNYCIWANNQDSLNIINNEIKSVGLSNTLIYVTGGINTSFNISKNNVTTSYNGLITNLTIYGIRVTGSKPGSGSFINNRTVNVDSNQIANCIFTGNTSFIGILVDVSSKTINVRANNYTNNTTLGNTKALNILGDVTSDINILCNKIEKNVLKSATVASNFDGINVSKYKSLNLTCNIIKNLIQESYLGTSSSISRIYGIITSPSSTVNSEEHFDSNTIDSIYSGGISHLFGLSTNIQYNSNSTISRTITNNKITRLYSNVSELIIGIEIGGNYAQNSCVISNNTISELQLDSNRAVKIIGLSLNGYLKDVLAYNNVISKLRTKNSFNPGARSAIKAVSTGAKRLKFYNNTIYLDAESGTNNNLGFSACAIETDTLFDLRNNIIINKSESIYPGISSILSLRAMIDSGINTLQNNNIYFLISPSVFYQNDSGSDSTLQLMKNRFYPGESNSIVEDVQFVNKIIFPYDFHINNLSQTLVEGGATFIPSILTDFDGDLRNTISPDIGADEGNFKVSAPIIDSIINSYRKIRFYWTLNNKSIKRFEVYKKNDSTNNYVLLDTISVIEKYEFIDSNLTNGIVYSYKLKTINSNSTASDFSDEIIGKPFNTPPIAVQLNDVYLSNQGRKVSNNYQFASFGSYDVNNPLDSIVWYVNSKRVDNSPLLNYGFRQGTSSIKLIVYDKDGATDTSAAFITINTFIKNMKGPVLAGLTAASDNLIYIADNSYDSSLGAKTIQIDSLGNTTFELSVLQRISTTPSVSSDSSVMISNGSILNGFTKSGSPLFGAISLGGLTYATPTVDSLLSRIYISVSNRKFFSINYKSGGVIAWDYTCDAPIVSSAVITLDRKLIFSDVIGNIYGFDISTTNSQGTIPKWRYFLNDSISTSPAIDLNGNVFVGSKNGNLYKLSFNQNGVVNVMWTTNLGSNITSSPVIDGNGFIYVGSKDGKLTKINNIAGSKIWVYNTGAAIRSTPAISDKGHIYVANENGLLSVLDTSSRLYWYYIDSSAITANLLHINGTTYIGTKGGKIIAFWDKDLQTYGRGFSSLITRPSWGTYQGNNRRTGSQLNANINVGLQNEKNLDALKIYPNPSESILYIEGIDLLDKHIIEINDIQGKKINKIAFFTRDYIDISELEKGVYILKIDYKVFKFIKK